MSTHRHINRICIAAVVIALLISVAFCNGESLGIQVQASEMEYESRLFDASKVHTIDILIDDWETFLSTCQTEEYSSCDVVIDGERYDDVGIRGKGNTSLTTVATMDSDRYSFKLEFDQYDSTKNYYGLDKLSLNNLIQDNTMMKDYLVYQMMNKFGVAAPLCSYVYITVNGEDWGLYLAVEAVEESFLQRNYGSSYGELYKPDSMDMGGARGNGMNFNPEDFMTDESSTAAPSMSTEEMQPGQTPPEAIGEPPAMPENFDSTQMEGFEPTQKIPPSSNTEGDTPQQPATPENSDVSRMEGMTFGGMGSSDVKLQYIDENANSYANIFDNAKTDVTDADQQRLIESLYALSNSESVESVVDVEAVIRYFVVHNYVVNADSYTGSMVHNYYLYEKDGQLSMIPWDYNLAFGTFQGGSADSMVNDAIDAPLSVSGTGDRPMVEWIFANEEYTDLYHQYFRRFLNSVDVSTIIEETTVLIAPYVEQDPTKFCTYAEFEAGVETLKDFCVLRTESVTAQLAGKDTTVDASSINLSDMGIMSQGMDHSITSPTDSDTTESAQAADTPNGTERTDTAPQFPEGFEGMTPGQRGNQTGLADFGTAQGSSPWILAGATLLVLIAGLVFVFKFRR